MNSTLLSVDEKLTAYDCTSTAREIELFIDDFQTGIPPIPRKILMGKSY